MDRIVDIATDGRHLSAFRGFLVVSEREAEIGRVPLDDIAAVIMHAHGVTWTTSLIAALAERGAPVVLCGTNHAPVAVCLPVEGHHAQNARLRAQWDAGKPLCKQLWKQVVVAKIRWQGAVLSAFDREAGAFEALARRVGSGDPDNVEAQAARRYWPLLMGADFRRDREAGGANAMLNYGYAILRSLAARAVVAAGLHPSIGIHHANRANAFALADDLMEPFRPLVDALTVHLLRQGASEVTTEVKRAFARLIAFDLDDGEGTTTVSVSVTRLAQGLASAFVGCTPAGFAPTLPPDRQHIHALPTLMS
jgi:CRISPR-associated protein Cas1